MQANNTDNSRLQGPSPQDASQSIASQPGETSSRITARANRSVVDARRLHYEESWVEIASQPSSSSLSSAADEIITTGLSVQNSIPARRRRKRHGQVHADTPSRLGTQLQRSSTTSSQEEYDESESESDDVLTSSNEALRPHHSNHPSASAPVVYSDDDHDANATAIGTVSAAGEVFTPPAHAFTPSNRSAPTSYFGSAHSTSTPRPRNAQLYRPVSPHHHTDYDAALRASLSTLLSCAAAARGLPKQHRMPREAGPSGLRIVPESVVLASSSNSPRPHSSNSHSPRSLIAGYEKGKRKAASPPTKDRSSIKKAKHIEDITPTLLTWVVSAGVVVLLSAVAFSTGYVIGKEAGYAEGAGALESGKCGREALRGGLRRWRFGTGSIAKAGA